MLHKLRLVRRDQFSSNGIISGDPLTGVIVVLLEEKLQFRILGSLEVRNAGKKLIVTAPKQQAVLVSLVLGANEFVSIDSLADYVWDGRPPAAYRTTLQAYVYRLRRLFERSPGVELSTGIAGYMLEVNPVAIDLPVFRQKVQLARELVKCREIDRATRELRDALSVWRGNALSGVPGELLQQEARFLESERLAAYEELLSLEISLGNHRRIIPELSKLVISHPLRETLAAQLMLALYRSGMQAEALQSYAAARSRLREELGIEPGAELQELHKGVLSRLPAESIPIPAWPE